MILLLTIHKEELFLDFKRQGGKNLKIFDLDYSCSLVAAITSSGSVIAAKLSGWVNSKLFIIFLKELVRFIK